MSGPQDAAPPSQTGQLPAGPQKNPEGPWSEVSHLPLFRVTSADTLAVGAAEATTGLTQSWGSGVVDAEERAAIRRRAREAAAELAFPDMGASPKRADRWGSAPKLLCPQGHRKDYLAPDGVLRCGECRNEASRRRNAAEARRDYRRAYQRTPEYRAKENARRRLGRAS